MPLPTPRASGSRGAPPAAGPISPRRAAWPVYGCAALCAWGASAGLLCVCGEADAQLPSARHALRVVGVPLAAGVILGLWLPRRVIRRHLEGGTAGTASQDTEREPPADPDARGQAARGVEYDFAAALTGALVFVLGLAWVLVAVLAATLEDYRGVLTHRFVLGPGLTRVALLAPLHGALLALGMIGATALVALHGWHRLVTQPVTGIARLWLVMLVAVGFGAVVLAGATPRVTLCLAAPLATFLAGIVAVGRRPVGAASPRIEPDLRMSPARLWRPLLAVGASAALAGAVLVAATPVTGATAGAGPGVLAALCGALAIGVVLACAALRMSSRAAELAPVCFLFAAVACLWPESATRDGAFLDAGWRVGLAGMATAACVVFAGRSVAIQLGRTQRALAWVGAVVAAGSGLGFAVAPGRVGTTPEPTAGRNDALVVGRTLLETSGLSSVRVSLARAGPRASMPSAWDLDLGGNRWDVVILTRDQPPDQALPRSADDARRLLRRCEAALRPGGRLVVELPADKLVRVALSTRQSEAYVLRIAGREARYAALILGPDVPAWLAPQPAPAGYDMWLYVVRRPDDVDDSLEPPAAWAPAEES